MRRVIPGNGRVVTTVVYGPDAWGVQAASLGAVVNTYSRASSGKRGLQGLEGFGVNAWHGASPWPMQHFRGLVRPITDPASQRLGAGAGVSGQPGLPSTGQLSGALGWTVGLPGIGPGLGG